MLKRMQFVALEDWENTAGCMQSLAEERMKPGASGDG